MPALLADAFPGVRARLEATSFLFTGQQIQKRSRWQSAGFEPHCNTEVQSSEQSGVQLIPSPETAKGGKGEFGDCWSMPVLWPEAWIP